MSKIKLSESMKYYFNYIENNVSKAKEIAEKARLKGLDPEKKIEIQMASNMAERVVGLVSVAAPQIVDSGVVERIVELEKKYGTLDWRVALQIAYEVAQEKFCKFKDQVEAIEIGIRVGFAYQTVGVVSSPLEGFTNLELKDRRDGKGKYFCLNFSGPIRNAGGTAASTCILIADYIRKKMNFAEYDPDEKEISRCHVEVSDYHERVTNLQYFPSKEESDFMIKNCPIEISGDPSEKFDVSNFKDLPRIPTNKIRSGFCLLHSSCLPLKAEKLWKKIQKWGKEMDLEQWFFLEKFIEIKKRVHSSSPSVQKSSDDEDDDIYKKNKIIPNNTYITDLVAGRPVFAYPMWTGGLRLRYGRSRTSGFSAQSINPATMHVLFDFIATGTQCKMERPGKAAAFTVCDTIEGPIVKLNNGDVIQLNDEKTALEYKKDIKEILFLGDVLQNYGDYLNRAHKLVRPGYCEEWWVQEFRKAVKDYYKIDIDLTLDLNDVNKKTKEYNDNKQELINKVSLDLKISNEKTNDFLFNYLYIKPTIEESKLISNIYKIPLHPKYIYHYKLISKDDLLLIYEELKKSKYEYKDLYLEKIIFEKNNNLKEVFEKIGIPHKFIQNEYIVLNHIEALSLVTVLDCENKKLISEKIESLKTLKGNTLEIIKAISPIKIRDKTGIFVGSRMGRPEKSKMRKMSGSPHMLFPVGEEGGRLKSFQSAQEKGFIESSFAIYYCEKCNKELPTSECPHCGSVAIKKNYCTKCNNYFDDKCPEHPDFTVSKKIMKIPIRDYIKYYRDKLGENILPDLIKGLRAVSNPGSVSENFFKGILRAKHEIYVNKDGTIRYDGSEVPITHFKPKEVHVSIDKLKSIGYNYDIYGNELQNEDQILELKPQDVVLPSSPDSPDERADDVFVKVANYIDELLVKQYNLEPFYNLKTKEDLVGHLAIGLAPHTSAGTICRIVGFSDTQSFLAHPLMHAAMRRDCDGDESCLFLLMDGFLNFSKSYLPSARGSTMDAPLVVTSILNPSEVDDMAFDMDIVWEYPLEFYEACYDFKNPWDVKLRTIGDVLGKNEQYEKMGFTHDTTNINQGVLCSAYKTLPSMKDKLNGQMAVAERLRSVNENDVARLVIDRHFLKDIKGNLRKFSQQELRCLNCNTKYRRPPLTQRCEVCGSFKLTFTIAQGSIIKYLQPSLDLMEKYKLPEYTEQTLEILNERVESVFGSDPEKQTSLDNFFK